MQQKTFDGSDYDHSRDSQKLSKQQEKIKTLLG